MPIIIESNDNFQERIDDIRRYVGMSISHTDDLTDDDIKSDGYLGDANRYIARKIPKWAELTENDLADAEVAVCKYAAANLLISTPRPTTLAATDVRDTQDYLSIEKARNILISEVQETTTRLTKGTTGEYTLFTLTGQ